MENKSDRDIKHLRSYGYAINTPSDIHVELSDGTSYVATFMTPEHIVAAMAECKGTRPPYDDYFSDPSIVIVRRVDMALIRRIVETMLEDGTFERHFERSSSPD